MESKKAVMEIETDEEDLYAAPQLAQTKRKASEETTSSLRLSWANKRRVIQDKDTDVIREREAATSSFSRGKQTAPCSV